MPTSRIALIGATLAALVWVVACKGNDRDEQQTSAPKAAAPAPAQGQEEKPDADEGEEGPTVPARVASEKPAPQQIAGKQFVYNFDSDMAERLPAKFHSAKTGGGTQEKWAVAADPTAPSRPNVVTQTSTDRTDYRFPLLISDEGSFQDLDLSLKFKAVSGSVDRAGGLVFRLKDANNYYIVRANALENNYRLYRVVNGWVEAMGDKITCYYDGSKKIESTDGTFKEAGKVGLWTKADSVTSFDDLRVTAK